MAKSKTKSKSKPPAKTRYKGKQRRANETQWSGADARRQAAASTSKKKSPRSQPLPGMEQVRSAKLDHLCEDIGDARAQMSSANATEAGAIQTALQVMQGKNVTVYKHAGVELVRVPGSEKLRVRVTKEKGDASVVDGATSVAGETDDEVGQERRTAVEELGGDNMGDAAGEAH